MKKKKVDYNKYYHNTWDKSPQESHMDVMGGALIKTMLSIITFFVVIVIVLFALELSGVEL